MAIILNDNQDVLINKPIDARYYSINQLPYINKNEVFAELPLYKRYRGQIVNINEVDYVFRNGISDLHLQPYLQSNIPTLEDVLRAGNEIGSNQKIRSPDFSNTFHLNNSGIYFNALLNLIQTICNRYGVYSETYIELQAKTFMNIQAYNYIALQGGGGEWVRLSTSKLTTGQTVYFPNASGTLALKDDLFEIKATEAPTNTIPSQSGYRNYFQCNKDSVVGMTKKYTIDANGNDTITTKVINDINEIIVISSTIVNNNTITTNTDAGFRIDKAGLTFKNRKASLVDTPELTFDASTLTTDTSLTIPNTGSAIQNLITDKFGIFTNYIRIGTTATTAVSAGNGGIKLQGNNLEFSDGTNWSRIERERNIVSKSGIATLLITEYIILCTNSSNFTLPTTSLRLGKTYIIYSDNFPLVINSGASTVTINGAESVSFTGYKRIEIRCLNATKWLTN